MKEKNLLLRNQPNYGILPQLILLAVVLVAPITISAQSSDYPAATDAADETTIQSRIERARALAAAHQLAAAARELESLRVTTADGSVRNVTSVMLMNIYLEEGNYARAEALLDETFRDQAGRKDRAIRTYFALAGQAVNGARAHLARYRTFGINVAEPDLPAEALSDLDRLRSLLERMIVQARIINKDDSYAYESLALLEDVLSVRLSVARSSDEREKWGSEYAAAREGLASSQRQIASIRGITSIDSRANSSNAGGSPSDSRLTTVKTGARQSSPNQDLSEAQGSAEEAGANSEKNADNTISAGLLNPRAEKKVVPSYPQIAKIAGVAGVVKVYVGVNEGGKVTSIFKSEGPVLLHQAAEDAARKWTFPPILIEGKPARLTGFIEFKFTF